MSNQIMCQYVTALVMQLARLRDQLRTLEASLPLDMPIRAGLSLIRQRADDLATSLLDFDKQFRALMELDPQGEKQPRE